MPQFYFRQYMNGQQMAKDQDGREFASLAEACTDAVRRAPGDRQDTCGPDRSDRTAPLAGDWPVSTPSLIRLSQWPNLKMRRST